jgi:tetratricopeptide (TPR) repeat protein
MTTPSASQSQERLQHLLGYLEFDLGNVALFADTIQAALAAGDTVLARRLIDQSEATHGASDELTNLRGLSSLKSGDYGQAARTFRALHESSPHDAALRFNLAWTLSFKKEFTEALTLLDEATCLALPQAAMLAVQIRHELGNFDNAADLARAMLTVHPDHAGLNAAVSVLALDIDDEALAFATARRAGDHPDALATLGTLALGEDEPSEALQYFTAALNANAAIPRAWIGRGLGRLLTGETSEGAVDIEKGASLFGDHLGSWIAAGWARLVAGDQPAARAHFEHALGLDRNFAESHGSIAVCDVLDGQTDAARRGAETAFRLDPECFSAVLARTFLLAGDNQPDKARAIFEKALHTPLGASGRTIARSLVRLGLGRMN